MVSGLPNEDVRPRSVLRLSAALVSALLLTAVALAPATQVAADEPGDEVELRVLAFNIFYGGDELNMKSFNWCRRAGGCPETFAQVVEAIQASNADVVGIQEAAMATRRLAEALEQADGATWYYDEQMHVISKYPLVDPPGADHYYTLVEVAPSKVVAIANTHLPAEPYGPYELRDGADPDEVLEIEKGTRLDQVTDYLDALDERLDPDIPVFFTGDFNTPSHLDWTAAAAAERGGFFVELAWPVSVALEDAGFVDSFREVHEDPVEKPGFTWTTGGPESVRNEVHDRIDWVLARGPEDSFRVTESQILGEKGGPDVDIEIDPYPTDHRGVVSTFEVTPADMPALVAVDQRRIERGDELTVRYRGVADEVVIVRTDAPDENLLSHLLDGTHDGTVTFATGELGPGAHDAVLVAGDDGLARIPFWVVEPGATPQVWTGKDVYAVGEPIDVHWKDAYGMRLDWFAIDGPGGNHTSPTARSCTTWPCGNPRYLMFEYLDGRIEGSLTFDEESHPGWRTWPLGPGAYEIRLLLDDHFRSVSSSPQFRVRS
jgi:endonuclease/exonuclease/phosphatase family metal-dependent hydrolase